MPPSPAAAGRRPRAPSCADAAPPPAASENTRTSPSVKAMRSLRSAARQPSYAVQQRGIAEVALRSRRCSAINSERLATSRSPRLKPMPATGCRPCAALPTITQRGALVRCARVNDSGYATRRPDLEEPAQPKSEASLHFGQEFLIRPAHGAIPPSPAGASIRACSGRRASGSRASGPCGVKRSYATCSWNFCGNTVVISAVCS